MDDPRLLRIITVGLVLASLAVGYFLLTGGFSVKKPKKAQTQNSQVAGITTPSPIPIATPASAYSRIAERTQSNVQTLPATGFPIGLIVVFSVGTLITGWSLRKYPC